MHCGDCEHFWEIKKTTKNRKAYIVTGRGYCLIHTVFAEGRPGNPVYPPKARVEELPDKRHKVKIIRNNHVETGCPHASKRK